MRFEVEHSTRLTYGGEVARSYNQVHLRPLDTPTQRLLRYDISIDPMATPLRHTDAFGNLVESFSISTPHSRLHVRTRSSVEVSQPIPVDEGPDWETLDRLRAEGPWYELTLPSRYVDSRVDAATARALRRHPRPADAARALALQIRTRFVYDTTATYVGRTTRQLLEDGRGVCQDYAHYFCGVARAAGIPVQYVSGYLATEELSSTPASHAWVEVVWPNGGVLELDPTNGENHPERRIRVAVGRDYDDVAPLKGVYFGLADQHLDVSIELRASGDDLTRRPNHRVLARRRVERYAVQSAQAAQQQQ
ncbi:MAG: transglutaminase family protein [Armatimonadetes bacterium]|nr:transglutaminase family protein [Armatimonadota bacterium]